jgi:hypothetical protein
MTGDRKALYAVAVTVVTICPTVPFTENEATVGATVYAPPTSEALPHDPAATTRVKESMTSCRSSSTSTEPVRGSGVATSEAMSVHPRSLRHQACLIAAVAVSDAVHS